MSDPAPTWLRPSASQVGGSAGVDAVEVAFVDGQVLVRNPGGDGEPLVFTPSEWQVFLQGAKAGEFDLS